MNIRLEALKDMKEDLLMRRCKISDEVLDDELELKIPVMEYNYNDIKRSIMDKPQTIMVKKPPKLRIRPSMDLKAPNYSNSQVIEEEKASH